MQVTILERGVSSTVHIKETDSLGRGAVGYVVPVITAAYQSSVAKIYHDPARFQPAKIEAMLRNPPKYVAVKIDGNDYPQYAWPTHIMSSLAGKPLGFLMPKVNVQQSMTLDHFYDLILLQGQKVPEEKSLSYKIEIARNLCSVLTELHAHKHFVVDFKPQNIKVFKQTHIVALLDCDSYSIAGRQKKRYPATNYTSEYIAPEALKNKIGPEGLFEYQDRFALAVVLFQLLNNGIHPFQGIQNNSVELAKNDDKVREGFYPHGVSPHPAISPRPSSVHHCFDDRTRAMFDRAFTANPSQRPSAREWNEHFSGILNLKMLQKCALYPEDPGHIHFVGKSCGTCYFEGRMHKMKPPQKRKVPKKWWRLSAVVVIAATILSAVFYTYARAPNMARVVSENLNLRGNPGVRDSPVLCVLPRDSIVQLQGHVPDQINGATRWVYVKAKVSAGVQEGWISASEQCNRGGGPCIEFYKGDINDYLYSTYLCSDGAGGG